MSIEHAEQLKKELTDKWVVVTSGIPELRRFESLTGRVKTVNMNCRALVEFDGPEDISWYDIDPGALTVVDAPRPKEKPEKPAKVAKATPAAKAAPKASGGSPLDAIRAAGGGAEPAAAKPVAGASPLDKIRAGGAAAPKDPPAAESAPEEPAAETPPPAPPVSGSVDTSGMSPLDAIRAQGAFKGNK